MPRQAVHASRLQSTTTGRENIACFIYHVRVYPKQQGKTSPFGRICVRDGKCVSFVQRPELSPCLSRLRQRANVRDIEAGTALPSLTDSDRPVVAVDNI